MTSIFDQHKAYWTNKSGMPSSLVEYVTDTSGLQILDLGCGGGRLAASFTNSTVYGLDNSAELLREAQQKHPNIKFVCGDFQSPEAWRQIPSLDMIVSNCAIRKDYCPHLADVMRICFDKLVPGGIMLLRIQSVSDLSEVLPKSTRELLFYSNDELSDCLKSFKWNVKEEAFRQKFSSVEYLKTFLKRTQLESEDIKCVNPTRRYNIVYAEKTK